MLYCFLALLLTQVPFLEPNAKTADHWVIQDWTAHDGAPVGMVTDVAFGVRGELVLATFEGLVEFDGRDFRRRTVATESALPRNRLLRLIPGPGDDMLILTEHLEVVRMRSGQLTLIEVLPPLANYHMDSMVASDPRDGTYAMVAREGITVLHADSTRTVGASLGQGKAVAIRPESGLFAILGSSLVRIDSEEVHVLATLPEEWRRFESLVVDGAGDLWGTAMGVVFRFDGTTLHIQEGAAWQLPAELKVDPLGRAWAISRTGGVFTDTDGRMAPTAPPVWPGLPSGESCLNNSLFVLGTGGQMAGITRCIPASVGRAFRVLRARDGDIWVATGQAGLVRLRYTPVQDVDLQADLNAYSVMRDSAGRLWVGGRGHLVCRGAACPALPEQGLPDAIVRSIHESPRGVVVAAGGTRIWNKSNERFEILTPPGAKEEGDTRGLSLTDSDGDLWIVADAGLRIWHEQDGTWLAPAGLDDTDFRRALFLGIAKGDGVWVGTAGAGLLHASKGSDGTVVVNKWGKAEGLCSDNIRGLFEPAENTLWIATEDSGLCRVEIDPDNGTLAATSITSASGLFDDALHNVVPDKQGRFWIASDRGLFWVFESELEAFHRGEVSHVFSRGYDQEDGLRDPEFNGGGLPSYWVETDGSILFTSQAGIVRARPDVARIPAPPSVYLTGIQDAFGHELSDGVELPPGDQEVSFTFSAPYFGPAREVKTRYRLLGYETAWRSVGTERRATYTNLASGDYLFEVVAGLGTRWSEPARFEFSRAPRMSETAWFKGLSVLIAMMFGLAIMAGRVRFAQLRQAELEKAVAQGRKDLSDTNIKLKTASEAKDAFLANLSHEIRTPLTLIDVPVKNVLETEAGLSLDARRSLGLVNRHVRDLLGQFNRMLDLSGLTFGAYSVTSQPLDLDAFVKFEVALFESMASNKELDLRYDGPGAVPINADPEAIETVIRNLITNAIKFTSGPGTISASTFLRDGHAGLIVQDTGDGISQEDLPFIFDRFYKANSTTARRPEGAGIGLALVRELVDALGGSIEVKSQPGEGAAFLLEFPVYRGVEPLLNPTARVEVVTSLPRVETSNGARSHHLLIVEDNTDLRDYLTHVLERDYRVDSASDGQEGLIQARDLMPDLIVSDVRMPEKSGFDLCHEIKSDKLTSHIPVLLLTAHVDLESRLQGHRAGADAYVAKPFDAIELKVQLKTLLENRERMWRSFSKGTPVTAEKNLGFSVLDQAFLAEFESRISASFHDSSFNSSKLADDLSMGARQLRGKLRGLTGKTPADYLRDYRLARAAEFLQMGVSVKEAAHAVGFSSRAHFSRLFQAEYGVAPSSYGVSTAHN